MDYVCKKCGLIKSHEFFVKNKATKYGIVFTCNACEKLVKKGYYLRNRKIFLKKCKERYASKKEEIRDYKKKYISTKHGKIMQVLQNIRKRCENPENNRFIRYGGRGIKNLISYNEVSSIWDRDNASSMLNPSIDRINVDGNYELTNCQFIEMKENQLKDSCIKVKQISMDGKLVKEWDSINSTNKEGFQHSNIIKCCKGLRRSHKGFVWSY